MKILASGDLHGDITLARKLAQKAHDENVDLVVLCGDLTYAESSTENLIGPFKEKNKQVLLIPGNHETIATADFLAKLYSVKNLHGESFKSEDIGFFGCGGANIGLFQLTEEEIFNTLKDSHEKIKDCKHRIMITHVHPSDSKMEKFTKFFPGSKGVSKAIKELKPTLHLCSHVHEAEGIEEKIDNTKIINVGKNGKIIEF